MTAPFYLSGTDIQRQLVLDALSVCDFPFERLLPSLQREGRDTIRVDWEDLSRYAASSEKAGHDHIHDGAAVGHPVERVVDGRARVLGLFYLPPYTRVVLDTSLTQLPRLAMEVFLAEAAHAVDYHFMSSDMRRAFVNSVHDEELPPGHSTDDGVAFHWSTGHVCSWFDVGPYDSWVGEAFMEGFIEAFAPSVPVTIQLGHPVGPEDRAVIRIALGVDAEPEPEPEPQEGDHPGTVVDPAPEVAAVFAVKGGGVYHDKHGGISHGQRFAGPSAAQEAGLRPCRVCKPGR